VGESDPVDRPGPGPTVAIDGVAGVDRPDRWLAIKCGCRTDTAGRCRALRSEQLALLADRAAAALALPTPRG